MAKVVDAAGGTPEGPPTQDQVVQAIFGWAVLFVLLIVASDVPMLSEIAAAFAWLLLLSIVLIYGPSALTNLNIFLKGVAKPS